MDNPRIGLALIARDEAEALPNLLDSLNFGPESGDQARPHPDVEPYVDYVVVCDTGSEDDTVKVARERGCLVTTFTWIDDFAAARNASFDAVPSACEWMMWADCDDLIEGGEKLRGLIESAPGVDGFVFPYDYAQDHVGNSICELWRERLVRRAAIGKWMLPIHEILQVEGQMVRSTDVIYRHRREGVRDDHRNYRILTADKAKSVAAGEPVNPRTLVYLGTEALALSKFEEAELQLLEFLEAGEWDEELCQGAHKLSITYRLRPKADEEQRLADLKLAERYALEAISHRPDWGDGYLDLADISLAYDQPAKALVYADKAIACGVPDTMLIINPLDYSFQPHLIRSIALAQTGEIKESFEVTMDLLEQTPYREDLRAQGAQVASELKAQDTEEAVLKLRELLVRHDENLKALALMENVPYYVRERPAIHQALLDSRENVLHATDPDNYESYYRSNPKEAPFEQTGIKIPDAHETFHRLKFLREGLRDQAESPMAQDLAKLRVLDLACNDGWMLANLGVSGFAFGPNGALHGVELNPDCATRANARASEFAALGSANFSVVNDDLHNCAEHFEPGTFDAVYAFELIEHVPDWSHTIDVMEKMLKPGGRIYLSTPDGAYERGDVAGWATVESKGHLRAITPEELAGEACQRGVVRGFEVPPERVQTVSFEPSPRGARIHIYAGMSEVAPEKIIAEGLGGSETAIAKMAEEFAREGCDVRVYAGARGEGLRSDRISVAQPPEFAGNVLYESAYAWDPGDPCDLFVSCRVPEAFDRTINSPQRLLWLHDADYGDRLTAERADRATEVAVMSKFQEQLLISKYPFLNGRTWVTRNGIETSFYDEVPAFADRQPWVIYSSSPDRGLDVLLECWAQVQEQVPDAVLHHTYAPVYHQFRTLYPHLQKFHERIEELHLPGLNIVRHGSMGQKALAEQFKQSRVWAYPSWCSPEAAAFPEISCISAMEAQAAGCWPVVQKYGALNETLRSGSHINPTLAEGGRSLGSAWRADFVDAIVAGLQPDLPQGQITDARTHALELSWEGVAADWMARYLAPPKVAAELQLKVAA